jgi:hypothetical protein
MVSGEDALVQITGLREIQEVSAWADNRDVTSAFHLSLQTQTWIGLLEGLVAGENHLEVRSGHDVVARLTIVNHDIADPIFSGPHQTPFICETATLALSAPIDANCSAYAGRTDDGYPKRVARPVSVEEVAILILQVRFCRLDIEGHTQTWPVPDGDKTAFDDRVR